MHCQRQERRTFPTDHLCCGLSEKGSHVLSTLFPGSRVGWGEPLGSAALLEELPHWRWVFRGHSLNPQLFSLFPVSD